MEKIKIKKREREILPAGLSQYHEYAYILWKSRTQMPGISEKQRKFRSRREEKRMHGFQWYKFIKLGFVYFSVTNYTSSPVRTIYMKVRKTVMTPMWERDIRKKETKRNPLIFLR